MQQQPLDSFSGGWKMRVALAALLFSHPDLLLLDEPSNHLDLEAVMWLEDFLKGYPATIVVVSHERDFLNNVVDHILHLQNGKITLYPGGYDSFERQRAERMAQLAAAKAKAAAFGPLQKHDPDQQDRQDRHAPRRDQKPAQGTGPGNRGGAVVAPGAGMGLGHSVRPRAS